MLSLAGKQFSSGDFESFSIHFWTFVLVRLLSINIVHRSHLHTRPINWSSSSIYSQSTLFNKGIQLEFVSYSDDLALNIYNALPKVEYIVKLLYTGWGRTLLSTLCGHLPPTQLVEIDNNWSNVVTSFNIIFKYRFAEFLSTLRHS